MSRLLCLENVALHYTQAGEGDPLVFVHGGGNDLSYWEDEIPTFAARYHVVAYSRRYAEPNRNTPIAPDYSARTDGDDLAALIAALDLAPAHVVAHSIGAVAAIFCAVEHPGLVRSLVVAEPPILRWACGTPEGDAAWERALHAMWEPAGAAFRAGRREEAMAIITDYFVGAGTFERLPARVQSRIMRNARDWEAFTISTAPFPALDRAAVARIGIPSLLLSAGRTVRIHRIVDDILAETLPGAERIHLPDASHDVWADEPAACRAATLDFLARAAA